MGLNLDEKKALVAEVGATVATAQAMVLAEYRSLEVGEITKLRAKARGAGVYLRVLKNTLARRAVAETPFAGLAQHMKGPLVYGMSPDPWLLPRSCMCLPRPMRSRHYGRGHANQVMSAKEVASLAGLPSRQSRWPNSSGPCRRRSPSSCKRSTKSRASLFAWWRRSGDQKGSPADCLTLNQSAGARPNAYRRASPLK